MLRRFKNEYRALRERNHGKGRWLSWVSESPYKTYKMKLISAITTGLVVVSSLFAFQGFEGLASAISGKTTKTEQEISDFEKAVQIIKKYETLHQPRHWPFVGYGHKVLPGEKFSRTKALGEKEADALLRKDLLKNCAMFRQFGADSLLLGVLAYNIGSGATMRSSVVSKLKAGNRNIYDSYVAHSRYRGKTHAGIKARRVEEFEALFVKEKKAAVNSHVTIPTQEPAWPARHQLTNGFEDTELLAQETERDGGNKPSRHETIYTNTQLACKQKSISYYWL